MRQVDCLKMSMLLFFAQLFPQGVSFCDLDHVTVSFARSGAPGGQNVNKVNTKVDMRFNVKEACWLSDRIREKILQIISLVHY
ncbi:putative aminoacyl-tRNA hydrolase [Helianthus debilis subsp. tardiflorus]